MDILSQAFLVSIDILSVGGEFLEIGDKDSCEVVFAIGCQFRDVDYRRLEKRREAEADGQCQFQVFLVVIMVWFS